MWVQLLGLELCSGTLPTGFGCVLRCLPCWPHPLSCFMDQGKCGHLLVDHTNRGSIQEFCNNAATHQDFSSGRCIHWLRQLVQARMTGFNIEAHIAGMGGGGLPNISTPLITPERPLTADNIHSTALLISLPSDWLHCVSALMNEELLTAACIITALKAENLWQKARGDNANNPISVSQAKTSLSPVTSPTQPPSDCPYCKFCKCVGHELNNCNNIKEVIKEHKAKRHQDYLAKHKGSSTPKLAKSSSNLARADAVSVFQLKDSLEVDDFSESKFEVTASASVSSLLAWILDPAPVDFNLDLGCSISMTPYLNSVDNPELDVVPVCLADNTVVRLTHSGFFPMPLGGSTSVETLVVPLLHKPLMSIAGMVDEGLTVCFNNTCCRIFNTSNLEIHSTEMGAGYRRGNLFYLPLVVDVRYPSVSSAVSFLSASARSSLKSTLFNFHWKLSHIGLNPLKALLKQNGFDHYWQMKLKFKSVPFAYNPKCIGLFLNLVHRTDPLFQAKLFIPMYAHSNKHLGKVIGTL